MNKIEHILQTSQTKMVAVLCWMGRIPTYQVSKNFINNVKLDGFILDK